MVGKQMEVGRCRMNWLLACARPEARRVVSRQLDGQ